MVASKTDAMTESLQVSSVQQDDPFSEIKGKAVADFKAVAYNDPFASNEMDESLDNDALNNELNKPESEVATIEQPFKVPSLG